MDAAGWHHLDIRVKGFSAFREAYGFLAADEALGLVAQVLTGALTEFGTPNDFIGTPEEARFTILTRAGGPESDSTALVDAFAATLVARLAERVKTLYKFEDAERGAVLLNPGTPEERQEVLMTLHIERTDLGGPSA